MRERVTVTGTGDIILGGRMPGIDTFGDNMRNTDRVEYTVRQINGTGWERRYGTYWSADNRLSRDRVLASSDSGADVVFSGLCDVYETVNGAPADAFTLGAPGDAADASVLNYLPKHMKTWRAAMAKVRAGTGRGTVLMLGDSTTAGAGAGIGGTSNLNAAFGKSYTSALAPLLNAHVATSFLSILGDQNTQVAYGTYDPRVSLGTGWTTSGGGTLGSHFFTFATGSAGTLGFTPAGNFDTIRVWYYQNTAYGTVAVNLDGGSTLGTINAAGTPLFTSQDIDVGSVTTGQIRLVAANDGILYIAGIVAFDSTAPAIDLIQGGWYGALAGSMTSSNSAFSPIPALQAIAPDLTFIHLTINDSNAGTDLTTYSDNLQIIITAAKESGDVVLVSGFPSNTAAATDGTLDAYVAAVYELAVTNDCAMLDFKARWVSYDDISPLLPYYDNLHPTAVGYQDAAQAICELLRRA